MRHAERTENAARRFIIGIAAGMTVCLLAPHVHAQEPPKAAEVEAAMKAPGQPEAYAACAVGETAEGTVKLEIVISKDGAFSLASTSPALGDEVTSCLAAAVATVKMRPVDRDYKMVYSLSLSPSPPAAPPPPSPPPGPPSAAGSVTQTKLQKIQTDPRFHMLERDYRRGVGILTGGVVMGTVSFVGIWVSWAPHLLRDEGNDALLATSIFMKVFFAIGAGAGIAMVVVGARKMEKALIQRNQLYFSGLDLSPTPGGTGAVLTSSFRF